MSEQEKFLTQMGTTPDVAKALVHGGNALAKSVDSPGDGPTDDSPQKRKKKLSEFLKEAPSDAIPIISAGIRPDQPTWTSYLWNNKRVWVPSRSIIFDAKEMHSGTPEIMQESFLLFEDGMVHEWSVQDLKNHLKISDLSDPDYHTVGLTTVHDVGIPHIGSLSHYNQSSTGINGFLHRNYHNQTREWDGENAKKIGALDDSFVKKTTHPLNVVSGLKHDPNETIKMARSHGDNGEHIHFHLPAFLSTTTNFGTAYGFTRRYEKDGLPKNDIHFLHIHMPVGSHGFAMDSNPDFPNYGEHEILLPRDTILRVNTKPEVYHTMGHKAHFWMSEVVGRNPTKLHEFE